MFILLRVILHIPAHNILYLHLCVHTISHTIIFCVALKGTKRDNDDS
jgi:hypothetical protein